MPDDTRQPYHLERPMPEDAYVCLPVEEWARLSSRDVEVLFPALSDGGAL